MSFLCLLSSLQSWLSASVVQNERGWNVKLTIPFLALGLLGGGGGGGAVALALQFCWRKPIRTETYKHQLHRTHIPVNHQLRKLVSEAGEKPYEHRLISTNFTARTPIKHHLRILVSESSVIQLQGSELTVCMGGKSNMGKCERFLVTARKYQCAKIGGGEGV